MRRGTVYALAPVGCLAMLIVAVPAQPASTAAEKRAFVAAEKKRFYAFKGERCGDRDTRVVKLPRGAKNVRMVQPSAGTMLLDFDEQAEVAQVLPLKVQRKKRRALVRAEGAGDICARPEAYEDIGFQTAAYDFVIRFKRPAPKR